MTRFVFVVSVWLAALCLLAGCAKQDPPPDPASQKVPLSRPPAPRAEAPPGPTAVEAAHRLMDFLTLVNSKRPKLVEATRRGELFAVRLRMVESDPKSERSFWMSADLQWLAHGLSHIDQRAETLLQERLFARCLVRQGLRIFIGDEGEATRRLLDAIGTFSQDAVIDCRGARAQLCSELKVTDMPLVRWKGGEEVGAKDRDWLIDKSECRKPEHLAIAAPDEVEPERLAERVHLLQSRAEEHPVELLSVRRDGEVWVVMLVVMGPKERRVKVITSGDGKYVLGNPVHMARATEDIERRRRFVDCLSERKAVLYVSAQSKESLAWLQSIGPEATAVAVDCAADMGRPACERLGIRAFPTAVVGRVQVPPPVDRRTLEAATGCK